MRNGSYTSSIVPASSPTAVAMVVMPTGPPLNFSIMALKMRLSISSKPFLSTFRASKAFFATAMLIFPSERIWAKSLTRLRSRFAIRGVPLERRGRTVAQNHQRQIPIYKQSHRQKHPARNLHCLLHSDFKGKHGGA